jgi:hypothetical protein
MSGAITPLPNTPSWHGAQVKQLTVFVMRLFNDNVIGLFIWSQFTDVR